MNTAGIRYCTRCGSPLTAAPFGAGLRCAHCPNSSVPETRILVACCVMHADRMLWMRRGLEPRRGFWAIPTGFLESGETTAEGAARELLEETGLRVEELDLTLHGLGSVAHMNEVYVVYRTRIRGDVSLTPSAEALEARFFTESELPWNEIAFPTVNYLARLTYADMRRGRHGVYLTQHERSLYIDQI